MSNTVTPSRPFKRLAVIGLGLIGGSLALAARRAGWVEEVVGCARHQETLDKGLALGVIDKGCLSPADAVKGADLVFLSVPVGAMAGVMKAIRPHLGVGAIVTDGGSVKAPIWRAARDFLPDISRFVPGHPVAGREKSGIDAASADLYQRHRVILTPAAETSVDALARIKALWQGVGAEVEAMEMDEHDRVLAETSHLPHLLAFSLVDTLSRQGDSHDIFRFAAGGFRDFTRIASSDPTMWHDIFCQNDEAVLAALTLFEEGLKRFRRAIETGDDDALLGIMQRANRAREHFLSLMGAAEGEMALLSRGGQGGNDKTRKGRGGDKSQ
jgi:prephenate dehydrogenase/3-phosphoshikimate 1-carboxyvinyltransferase